MPRRMVTSELFKNEKVSELDFAGRYFFIGLITHADDDGRLKGSSKYLKGNIFPYDDISLETITEYKKLCNSLGIIYLYVVNDIEYIYFPNWKNHQTIRSDRYKPSMLPSPNGDKSDTNGIPDVYHTDTAGMLKLSKDKLSKDNIIATVFKTFDDNFQRLTPTTTENINDLIDEYSADKVLEALNISIKRNKRNLSYVEGILKKDSKNKPSNSEPPKKYSHLVKK